MQNFCECGCGRPTNIAKQTSRRHGHVKGRPVRFVSGHNGKKHGKCGSRAYKTWQKIIQRCENPSDTAYAYYGGRGITVCKRWLRFENFYADMGDPPPRLTLERENNSKGYSKANCVWADRKTQARNLRSNRWFVFRGERMLLVDVAKASGIRRATLHNRVYRAGMSIDKAVAAKLYSRASA